MNIEEASDAAVVINPKVAIPMHYGETVGRADDGKKFAELLKGKIEVQIPKKEG